MWILKHIPEDFVVEELLDWRAAADGRYLLVKVTKRNVTTEEAAVLLCRHLGIGRKSLGYAGTKDRRGITTQHFTLKGASSESLSGFFHRSLTVEPLGRMRAPLGLGALRGNRFTIVLRNLDGPVPVLPSAIPNYFDEQRFGSHNAEIGKLLVKKDFPEAIRLIRESNPREGKNAHDVNSLMSLPHTLLKLYLHAFQSLLWNRVLAAYVCEKDAGAARLEYSKGELLFPKRKIPEVVIPLPGFGMEFESEKIEQLVMTVLKKEGLSARDFVIRQLPNLSMEGVPRCALMSVEDYHVSPLVEDDAFPSRKKATLSFTLGPGSYATMVVKASFALR